jgi:hypothetical protein
VLERRPEATTRGGWTKPAVKPRHAAKKNIFPTWWLSQRLLSRTRATQGVLGHCVNRVSSVTVLRSQINTDSSNRYLSHQRTTDSRLPLSILFPLVPLRGCAWLAECPRSLVRVLVLPPESCCPVAVRVLLPGRRHQHGRRRRHAHLRTRNDASLRQLVRPCSEDAARHAPPPSNSPTRDAAGHDHPLAAVLSGLPGLPFASIKGLGDRHGVSRAHPSWPRMHVPSLDSCAPEATALAPRASLEPLASGACPCHVRRHQRNQLPAPPLPRLRRRRNGARESDTCPFACSPAMRLPPLYS